MPGNVDASETDTTTSSYFSCSHLWSHDTVPGIDKDEFKRLVFRKTASLQITDAPGRGLTGLEGGLDLEKENSGKQADQIFAPKDEHCGIWNASPNPKCHASFGDQGTTASVNCYGHLIQMSRFLGAGRSGMFSMNHRSTPDPCMVYKRAGDLHTLSTSKTDDLTFLLDLPSQFCSNEPPRVKWVNWRWPRYEYATQLPKVRACLQWVVHEGAVLQQFVLENSGEEPVDFQFRLPKDIQVHDLDYLRRGYGIHFRNWCVPGPNGYGHIYVRDLGRRTGRGYQSEVGVSSSENEGVTGQKAPIWAQPSKPVLARTLNTDTAMANANDEVNAPAVAESGEGDPKLVVNTDENIKNTASVVALINLFVNGRAVKIQDDRDLWHMHTLGGNRNDSRGMIHETLEIVVAYKLIILPGGKVDWKNFLVAANQADVSKILREETERLWGGAGTSSLCSLGLSLGEVMDTVIPISEQTGAGRNDIGNVRPEEKGTPSDHIDAEMEPHTTVDSGKTAASFEKADNSTNTPDGAQSHSGPESTEFSLPSWTRPSGTPTQESPPESHIEYVAWIHLEYVLSVCAVPVLTPTLEDCSTQKRDLHSVSQTTPWEDKAEEDDTPVALTCGDMSGHRICTSASYFAFQFLIEVAKKLAHHPAPNPYIKTTLKRIRKVLHGHVRWLESLRIMNQPIAEGKRKRLLKSGCFSANYWVTGQIQHSDMRRFSGQPNDSVTDTPFHILKLIDYMDLCKGFGDKRQEAEVLIRRILRDVWVPWYHELDDLDKRASFAWPHAKGKSFNTYRLADQFWIWKTLKALHDSGVSNQELSTNSSENEPSVWNSAEKEWILHFYDSDLPKADTKERFYEKFGQVTKRLHPHDVQRGILQRFTTENAIFRKRMLAVTRSPRETRFLFHARDTALFYGQDCGFFLPETSFQELWNKTIEAQIHHNGNHDAGWGKALRYALGIVVGCRHLTLNKKCPKELVKRSVQVLLRSTSHNGFFPGQLDMATKEPDLFHDQRERDSYYHANFEIHYILLTHGRAFDENFKATTTKPLQLLKCASTMPSRDRQNEPSHHLPSQTADASSETTAQTRIQEAVCERPIHQSNPASNELALDSHIHGQRSVVAKKAIPFNNLIDTPKISTMEDEWLYPCPHFFSTARIDITRHINRHILRPWLRRRQEDGRPTFPTSKPSSDPFETIIEHELARYRDPKRKMTITNREFSRIFVADRPKQKLLGKREKWDLENMNTTGLGNFSLALKLGAPRTPEQAKKRFVWLPDANEKTALICWAASPEEETVAISRFFTRHSKYEKHIWDDTTRVLNTWKTELHLSFYVLVGYNERRVTGLPCLSRYLFPGGSTKEIRRASMGFRFDGDFFDRYWTCHYIEHVPNKFSPFPWPLPFSSCGKDTHKERWQRRVLELYLLHCIMREIAESALNILTQVRMELGAGEKSTLSFSILESEAYSATKDSWHKFEQILHALEEDLTSNLGVIQKWSSREPDRGQEQPRWTSSRERKYRGAINKYRGSIERRTRDLETHRDTMRKLKDNLATNRQNIRDDRELRRNENIRYFTYATVIFLPLDFAASFYSMNGIPENDLLISLVKFAVGAFVVTVALLASAKRLFLAVDVLVVPLRHMISRAGLAIEKYSRFTMVGSFLTHRRTTKNLKKHLARESVKRDFMSPYYFWPAYIFFEIPALGVLTAFSELKSGNFSPQAIAHILLGIILLPIFGLSWLLRIILLNIYDVAKLLGGWDVIFNCCTACFADSPDTENVGTRLLKWSTGLNKNTGETNTVPFHRRFDRMVDIPKVTRPLKILHDRIKRKSKSATNSSSEESWQDDGVSDL